MPVLMAGKAMDFRSLFLGERQTILHRLAQQSSASAGHARSKPAHGVDDESGRELAATGDDRLACSQRSAILR